MDNLTLPIIYCPVLESNQSPYHNSLPDTKQALGHCVYYLYVGRCACGLEKDSPRQ